MPRWKVRGFLIVQRLADHPPLHVHVLKDRELVGRFDVENRTWMEGPYHAGDQARAAIEEWLDRHVEGREV
jgi:hypothetical protein